MLRCCGTSYMAAWQPTCTMLFHCVAPVHQVHLPTCIESSMWAQNSLRELWAVSTDPTRPLQGQAGPDIWEALSLLGLILMPESESGPGPICRVPYWSVQIYLQAARRGEERIRHSWPDSPCGCADTSITTYQYPYLGTGPSATSRCTPTA